MKKGEKKIIEIFGKQIECVVVSVDDERATLKEIGNDPRFFECLVEYGIAKEIKKGSE
jgi:hypothetical protein